MGPAESTAFGGSAGPLGRVAGIAPASGWLRRLSGFEAVFGPYHRLHRLTLGLILIEGCAALLLSWLGKAGAPLVVSAVMLSAMLLPFLAWAAVVAVKLPLRRVARPSYTFYRLARVRRIWFLRAGILMGFNGLFAASFGMTKSAIPKIVPFYADDLFARMDRALLGQDAWQFSARLLGDQATVVLDRCYLLWFPAMFLLMAFLFSTRDERLQARGLFTFFASWTLLGTLAATATSSVGPILYDRIYGLHRFGGLIARLGRIDAAYGLHVGSVVNYLSDSNAVPKFGGGISAMPSLHVGVAFLICLITRERGTTWLWLVSIAFFAAILLGSIDLGWHYLVDGLAAMAGVYALWRLSERIARQIDRQATTEGASHG